MKELNEQQIKEKPELESRFAALVDRNLVASELKISNLQLHFNNNIVANDNREKAEELMLQLEAIDESQADIRREFELEAFRNKRDMILVKTDWLMLSDVTVDQKHRRSFIEYRQYIRDIPQKVKRNDVLYIEPFSNWLRRKHPEEFLDGGTGAKMIYKFTYYYEE